MNRRPPTSRREQPIDDGSITLFAVVIFIALLAATGLVVDGGTRLRAARQATAIAEEAARAGAGQVGRDRAYAHGGHFTIDQNTALTAARAYLTNSHTAGTITPKKHTKSASPSTNPQPC